MEAHRMTRPTRRPRAIAISIAAPADATRSWLGLLATLAAAAAAVLLGA
jgi:hypothetical protein